MRELERQKRFLERTQEMAVVGGWEFEVETHKVVWTQEIFRMLELDQGVGMPPFEQLLSFLSPEHRKLVTDAHTTAIEKRLPYHLEVAALTRTALVVERTATRTRMFGRRPAAVECDHQPGAQRPRRDARGRHADLSHRRRRPGVPAARSGGHRDYWSGWGIRVLEARRGLEKLATAGAQVDLMILDLVMPGMTGEETFRLARELMPALPVVVCSGFAPEPLLRSLQAEPRTARLDKPFTTQELQRAIRSLL